MLELRNLRYMVALSRRLNYARAADDLGITQSALSRSIQSLEAEFGVQLFDRGRAGVTPTTAGRQLIERATILLVNADDLDHLFRGMGAGKIGSLRFGIVPLAARALLAKSLSERLTAAPDIKHDIIVRNIDALWPMLIAGEIEFLVASPSQVPDTPPIRIENLGEFPLSLVVRPGHPLMVGECPDNRFPVLLSSYGSRTRGASTDFLTEVGAPFHVIEEFDTLIKLTRTTDAIWMTSSYAVADELTDGILCELPHRGHVFAGAFEIAMLSLDRRSLSPAAQLMKQSLRRQFDARRKNLGEGD